MGCGTIAQNSYLPALAALKSRFDRIWPLSIATKRREKKALSIVGGQPARDLSDIGAEIQFAIIATPNDSHFPLAMEALSRGCHVLVEKPFVLSPDDGQALIERSTECKRIVAVNQTRRFFPHTQDLRHRIAEGHFGRLLSVTHTEGVKMTWPFQSGAAFTKGAKRTGVIMDIGVHVIDFYQYLLEPKWAMIAAAHDGFAGPEGLANIELTASSVPVTLRLSRYEQQLNMARLSFEHFDVSIRIYDSNSYSIQAKSGAVRRITAPNAVSKPGALFEMLLSNFVDAAEGQDRAMCDAISSLPVIGVLDKIYREARLFPAMLGVV